MWSLQTSIVLPATPPSHIWGMTSAPSWFVGLLSKILLLSCKCVRLKYWKHFPVYMSAILHVNLMFSACVLMPLHKWQKSAAGQGQRVAWLSKLKPWITLTDERFAKEFKEQFRGVRLVRGHGSGVVNMPVAPWAAVDQRPSDWTDAPLRLHS